jgi:hypothetical protein
MTPPKNQPDIARIVADGHLIDQALSESVRKALQEHKRAGNPIAIWQNNKVVMIKPDAIHT